MVYFLTAAWRTKRDPRAAYPRLTWEPGPRGQHPGSRIVTPALKVETRPY